MKVLEFYAISIILYGSECWTISQCMKYWLYAQKDTENSMNGSNDQQRRERWYWKSRKEIWDSLADNETEQLGNTRYIRGKEIRGRQQSTDLTPLC